MSVLEEAVCLRLKGFALFSMQPTLIIWGEHDQVFPLELGHRLKRFITLSL